jgi:hypothetical protein
LIRRPFLASPLAAAALAGFILAARSAAGGPASKFGAMAKGWRLPVAGELRSEWRLGPKGNYASVRGDFDGDGKLDEARLMVSTDGRGVGVVAELSRLGTKVVVTIPGEIGSLGIAPLAPGHYSTTCGQNHDCEGDEIPEVALPWVGLDVFKDLDLDSVFYLTPGDTSFRQGWFSE